MTNGDHEHIFFVDDEPKVCKAIEDTFEQLGKRVTCFTSARDCLEQLGSQRCDLLIADLKVPGMDGMELLKEAKRTLPLLPVLIITGYGDIPTAITAIKAGAADFIEKPLIGDKFLQKVMSILQQNDSAEPSISESLTKREARILRLIIEGRSSKEIAHLLNRSVRTIEVHRSHIMQKLCVDNIIDLVKRAAAMGPVGLLAKQSHNDTRS